MEVDVSGYSELPSLRHAVLKMYDRRYAAFMRAVHNLTCFELAEEEYRQFMLSPEGNKFAWKLAANEVTEDEAIDDHNGWERARKEAYLSNQCQNLYRKEFEAYRSVEQLQGVGNGPRLYTSVKLNLWPVEDRLSDYKAQSFLDVPGVLLEYVEGYSVGNEDYLPLSMIVARRKKGGSSRLADWYEN